MDRDRQTGCSYGYRSCSRIPVSGRLFSSSATAPYGEASRLSFFQSLVRISCVLTGPACMLAQPVDKVLLHHYLSPANAQRGETCLIQQIIRSSAGQVQRFGKLRRVQNIRQRFKRFFSNNGSFPPCKKAATIFRDCLCLAYLSCYGMRIYDFLC